MSPEELTVAGAIFAWLEIRSRSGQLDELPLTADRLMEDATRSALLARLLSGHAPLAEPPPTSLGQPWYQIVEEGRARVMVEDIPPSLARAYPNHILINRFPWLILDNAESDSYLVAWKPDGPVHWLARIKGDNSPMPWALMRVFREDA